MLQTCATRLIDECRVRTPIRQSLKCSKLNECFEIKQKKSKLPLLLLTQKAFTILLQNYNHKALRCSEMLPSNLCAIVICSNYLNSNHLNTEHLYSGII